MKELIEKVYTEERPRLLSWMKTRISHDDAEDILQTVIIRSLQNLDSLAGIKDLTAWLWRSAQNGIIDHWRRKRTRRNAGESFVFDDELIEAVIDRNALGVSDVLERKETAQAVSRAIRALSDEQRMVILSQAVNGETFASISKRTGIPVETLAARKRYALEKLRKSLAITGVVGALAYL